MKWRPEIRRLMLVALATLVLGGVAAGATFAAFKSQTETPAIP